MKSSTEFQEIGHCGGTFKIHVKTDELGNRAFSIGWEMSSPMPGGLVGVQVTFDGQILGLTALGWQPSKENGPPQESNSFTVLVGSDKLGMFGHQCRNCGCYWRSESTPVFWNTTCAKCGLSAPSLEFPRFDGQL